MTEAQPVIREVVDLTPLIREVVDLRREAALAKDAIRVLRDAWAAEHETQLTDVIELEQLLAQSESTLRGKALDNYLATGDKQVAPGVVIRVNHKAVYDVKVATERSTSHGGIAHVFDSKVFEKLALANPALTAEFVQIEDVPIATLAKDLGTKEGERP